MVQHHNETEEFTPWTPIEKLVPYILPTMMALCLSGIAWAVKTQSVQDQKLEVVIYNQKQVMSDLRILTSRVDRNDTPEAIHIDRLEDRVISLESECTKISVMEANLRRLEEEIKTRKP